MRGPLEAGPDTALAAVRAGDCGPDTVHDPVRLVLGNLDELVLQVAALGRDQRWAAVPDEIGGECFIAAAAGREIDTPEHAGGPLTAAQVVNDRVVGDLIWHLGVSLGNRECRQRLVEQVLHWRLSPGMLPVPFPQTCRLAAYVAVRRRHV